MCGIAACRGSSSAIDYLLSALQRLEYRGYDSAGVALAGDELTVLRAVGRLSALRSIVENGAAINRCTGIGHTRWATHGAVTVDNAHPHQDCSGRLAVVHNGIIENASELRSSLQSRGHVFRSEVDTEVVAHLLEDERGAGRGVAAAMRAIMPHLHGRWAVAITEAGSDAVTVSARGCPLVLARSDDTCYAASDSTALLGWASHMQFLRDGDIVEMGEELRWLGAGGELEPERPRVLMGWSAADVEVGVFDDFMEKEIAEQPKVAERLIDRIMPDLSEGQLVHRLGLPVHDRIRFVACGSSHHAALVAAGVLRATASMPTEVVIASEHGRYPVEPGTLTVAVSQSGETADVLAALESQEGQYLAITNAPHSTLARGAAGVMTCDAGPEIGVAATKTFVAQVITATGLALAEARLRGRLKDAEFGLLSEQFAMIPDRLAMATERSALPASAVADRHSKAPGWAFVSRGSGLPLAAEGALKLKEISYRWTEAVPAGELKHGPIALIEAGVPVVAVESGEGAKLQANIEEVQARGAEVLRVGAGPKCEIEISDPGPVPPWGRLEAVVALQHLARYLALELGHDVDKPRNLAKSVTVE